MNGMKHTYPKDVHCIACPLHPWKGRLHVVIDSTAVIKIAVQSIAELPERLLEKKKTKIKNNQKNPRQHKLGNKNVKCHLNSETLAPDSGLQLRRMNLSIMFMISISLR